MEEWIKDMIEERHKAINAAIDKIDIDVATFVVEQYPSIHQMIEHSTEEMKDFFGNIMKDIYSGIVDAIDAGSIATVENSWDDKDIEKFAILTIQIYTDKAKEKIRAEVRKWEEE